MEKAVENLELMFKKAEADMNFLSRKLDFQLENEQGLNVQHNPVKLLKKVEEVKAEYAGLVQDVSEIQKAQKDAVDFFKSQLLSLTQVLGRLEAETGCDPELSEATAKQFEELSERLGISKEDILPSASEDISSSSTTSLTGAENVAVCSSNVVSESDSNESMTKKDANPELSPYDLRASSREFIEVTKKEFMTVSDLIRGRVKLEDVNKTYKILWEHFKEEGNTEVMTTKDMNNKGMRITGATGQAKLKTLRALKLCSMSKDGSVKLL